MCQFALCVRTQINVYITGCIVTPPNNKTRLKRFICVHNGHYTRKQDETRLKMYKYAIIQPKSVYLYVKKC